MTVSRLDSVSPDLAAAFRAAAPSLQRKAALVACEIAAQRAGLDRGQVVAALESLRHGKVGGTVRQQLERLAARLDDEYFRLTEESDPAKKPQALRFFSKARAASALALAASEDDKQLDEAIYEASTAVDDAADIFRPVQEALLS